MKTALRSIVFLVLVATLLFPAGFAASAKSESGGKLSPHDRELLAEAKAEGKSKITLLVASKLGKIPKSPRRLRAWEAKSTTATTTLPTCGCLLRWVKSRQLLPKRRPGCGCQRDHPVGGSTP